MTASDIAEQVANMNAYLSGITFRHRDISEFVLIPACMLLLGAFIVVSINKIIEDEVEARLAAKASEADAQLESEESESEDEHSEDEHSEDEQADDEHDDEQEEAFEPEPEPQQVPENTCCVSAEYEHYMYEQFMTYVQLMEELSARVEFMKGELSVLKTLCPQLHERKIPIGGPNTVWPFHELLLGDRVLITYRTVNIVDDSVYSDIKLLTIDTRGARITPLDITLGPGEKLLVLSAVREYGSFRPLATTFDITKTAKQYLETIPLVCPR